MFAFGNMNGSTNLDHSFRDCTMNKYFTEKNNCFSIKSHRDLIPFHKEKHINRLVSIVKIELLIYFILGFS